MEQWERADDRAKSLLLWGSWSDGRHQPCECCGTVYRDPATGTWYWSCRVPLCGANDWSPGGQPGALRVGLDHLGRHRRVGFALHGQLEHGR